MRPMAIVNGMLFGSLAAIFLSLAVVLLIFMLLAGENPELRNELPMLWRYTGVFGALAGLSAWAFLGQLKTAPWRWYAEVVLAIGLAGMAYLFLA